MIRMIQSQSANQAKEYFNDALSKSDYYLNDQELNGHFQGRIAHRMGVTGEATKDAFNALCENIHPVTGQKLTERTITNRTVGYDINFHCPKSVSVLHALAKDNHILEAFEQSVRDTMVDIEADGKTRVRKKGKDEDRETGELLWADFVHQTARPVNGFVPDPHLHCHCYTFNVTWDKVEKKFKAGQFRDIKRDMPYYEARFQKRLADNLITLGYLVRSNKKSFEVLGVPEKVIDLFSKRTNEIGRVAKENNITNEKELDKLGAYTRGKKQKGLSMSQFKREWRKQIAEMGITGKESGDKAIRFAPKNKAQKITAKQCLDHAMLHRFERASVVHDRRILETAYRFGIGDNSVSVDQIGNAFKQNHDIITIKDGLRFLCTTKEVLAEEQRMVNLANAGKGNLVPLYTLPPSILLEGEQADAVRHILTTADRVSIILGRAGTGKTTLMKEAVAQMEKSGKKVVVIAPTAQASRGVLRDEGFKNAETVAKLLSDPNLQTPSPAR